MRGSLTATKVLRPPIICWCKPQVNSPRKSGSPLRSERLQVENDHEAVAVGRCEQVTHDYYMGRLRTGEFKGHSYPNITDVVEGKDQT